VTRKLRDAKARLILIVYHSAEGSSNITLLCYLELTRQTGVTGLGFADIYSGSGAASVIGTAADCFRVPFGSISFLQDSFLYRRVFSIPAKSWFFRRQYHVSRRHNTLLRLKPTETHEDDMGRCGVACTRFQVSC
jgi:hypothetical protein